MGVFSHKNARVDYGGSEIQMDANSCSLTIDAGVSEVTSFEDTWDEFVADILSWSFQISGFTEMSATGMEALLFAFAEAASAQELIYYPQGDTAGYKYTGNAFVTSHAVGGDMKGGCPFSASFQGTGALTRTSVV